MPAGHRPFEDRQRRVGDHQPRVDTLHHAGAAARRARTKRIVETEQIERRFLEFYPIHLHQVAETLLFNRIPLFHLHHTTPLPFFEGGLHRCGQTALHIVNFRHLETVDKDKQSYRFGVFSSIYKIFYINNLLIIHQTTISFLLKDGELFGEGAVGNHHHGRQHI